ncbi:protein suppressor 2 of zeste-like isoform X2 [Mercenaria mercenaria]|nr:protein suppressor 2 of zeste-like isoform X2 [Mercenaria mercenaria]
MQRIKRLRVSEVNPHLICVLCGGYYIDATTIIECLHTFCKTCIVGYLEASKHCPVCDNLVHKTKPHLRLRPDHTLQDLVYKLVPGLFQDEMKKRREFYKEEIESGRVGENGIPEERERIIYSADEQISVVIELSSDGNAPYSTSGRSSRQPRLEAADRRYLSCPGNFTVGHLKKFIKMKFNLCDRFQIDFYHTDETLHDHYTLVDIAYIYSWRRKGPLRLYYTVYTNQAKRFKAENEETVPMETDATNSSDLKTETSGYITDEEKISENEKSFSQESDESKHDSVLEGDGIDIENKTVNIGEIKISEKRESVQDSEKTEILQADPKDEMGDSEEKSELSDIPEIGKADKEKDHSESVKDDNELDSRVVDSGMKSDSESAKVLTDKQKISTDNECEKPDVKTSDNVSSGSQETELNKSETEEIVREIKKHETKVKPEMVEASTGTSSVSPTEEKCNIEIFKQSKSVITDEDISEPVVSSTQNTQGCQTEPPGSSHSDTRDVPHSSEVDITRSTLSPSCKSTVDVSCETDNFVISRQASVDSVSVSTETETEKNETAVNRRKLVDCSTDVYDFPKSESETKLTVDCSTDLDGFPADSTKRKALTVDCSTSVDSIATSSNKRKSIESEPYTESNKSLKKTDSKSYRRSYSYAGHLSTPKAAYLAQPLSPTKMKFTSPKSPVRTPPNTPAPKSPSRAETSGFQSQYQSFVRTEITYRFDEEDPPTSKPVTAQKSVVTPSMSLSQSFATTQKTKPVSKTGRPRGRPPKNRSLECLPPPKEKKHKSRSHSPKHRKNSEKERERNSSLGGTDKLKSSKPVSSDQAKSSTAYSWINKIDSASKQVSDRKGQKPKQDSSSEKNASDLRIPKQFLYFSNGQYTIATVSSLSTLKQSSPVSPPPKTVFTAEVNGKNKSKPADYDSKMQKYTNTSQQVTQNESKGSEKCEQKLDKTVDVKNVQKKEKPQKSSQKPEHHIDSQSSHKIDSNQNRIVKTSVDITKQINIVKETDRDTDSNKETNKEANKDVPKESPTVSVPEYRHQSPFFASISNAAKLQAPHRPTAHLNVPNLSSHFSGTHHLYSQGRYTNERLGTPIYRSFSMNDKSPTATMASKFEEARRFEAIASASQVGYLGPFPAPYLGLMHSHLVSSLPPPPPLSKPGHYPDSSRSLSFSDNSLNCSNTLSQNTAKHLTKPTYTNPKGKEKSIDRIISAITEMRAKKETQEQLNGIDLSTKGNRQQDKSKDALNEPKADRYEFTDDDTAPRPPQKVTCNSDSVSRKDAV